MSKTHLCPLTNLPADGKYCLECKFWDECEYLERVPLPIHIKVTLLTILVFFLSIIGMFFYEVYEVLYAINNAF